MRKNHYDDKTFFDKYAQMTRSVDGLSGAGEWPTLKKMLPDFAGKRVLDLGCGYGWHCRYAAEMGAASVVGLDLSERMLARAREFETPGIEYLCASIEDAPLPPEGFDAVISSLALHYVADFDAAAQKIYALLAPGGDFVFSVEHPIFTADGPQDWCYDEAGEKRHWPVDRYFSEGKRESVFLGERIEKYHRTLTGYVRALIKAGFEIVDLAEPQPENPDAMPDELRRPMMLIIAAKKTGGQTK